MTSLMKTGKGVTFLVLAAVAMAGMGIGFMSLSCGGGGGGGEAFKITIAPDYPNEATTGVRLIANMGVWFSPGTSDVIDPATLTVTLTEAGGGAAPLTSYINSEKNFVIVRPNQFLKANTTYNISVTAGPPGKATITESKDFTTGGAGTNPNLVVCESTKFPSSTTPCSGYSLTVTFDQPATLASIVQSQIPPLITSMIDLITSTVDSNTGYFQVAGGSLDKTVYPTPGTCPSANPMPIQKGADAVTVSLGGNYQGNFIRIGGQLKFPIASFGTLTVSDFGLSGDINNVSGDIENGIIVAVVKCADLFSAIGLSLPDLCDANGNLVLVGRFNGKNCPIPRNYGPVEGYFSDQFTGTTIPAVAGTTLPVTYTTGTGFTIGDHIPNIALIKRNADDFLSSPTQGDSSPIPFTGPITGAGFTPSGSNWVGGVNYKALSTIDLIKITETTFSTSP